MIVQPLPPFFDKNKSISYPFFVAQYFASRQIRISKNRLGLLDRGCFERKLNSFVTCSQVDDTRESIVYLIHSNINLESHNILEPPFIVLQYIYIIFNLFKTIRTTFKESKIIYTQNHSFLEEKDLTYFQIQMSIRVISPRASPLFHRTRLRRNSSESG